MKAIVWSHAHTHTVTHTHTHTLTDRSTCVTTPREENDETRQTDVNKLPMQLDLV